MLEKFSVNNYRNIKMDEVLSLDGLNIFIGPNGAGKSNLFEALKFASDCLRNGLHKAILDRRGITSILNKSKNLPSSICFNWQFSPIPMFSKNISIEYLLDLDVQREMTFQINKEALQEVKPRKSNENDPWKYLEFRYGHGVLNRYENNMPTGFIQKDTVSPNELVLKEISSRVDYPALFEVRSEVMSWRFYNGNNMSINTIQDNPADIDPLELYLSSNGDNLAMVFSNLISKDEEGFEAKLYRVLQALFDDFGSLKFPFIDSNHLEMRWKNKSSKKPLTLNELSDGTIRMLCWIAILAHPSPPPLLCIDEPELGIHPAWIPILGDLIKSAAEKSQVLIATHSPDLLDCFSDVSENIIVIEADEKGMALFNRLDIDELQEWLKKYKLGELFRNREAVIGGWPY